MLSLYPSVPVYCELDTGDVAGFTVPCPSEGTERRRYVRFHSTAVGVHHGSRQLQTLPHENTVSVSLDVEVASCMTSHCWPAVGACSRLDIALLQMLENHHVPRVFCLPEIFSNFHPDEMGRG